MKLTNSQMDEYLCSLQQIALKTKGKLAYVIAKNIRILQTELLEYLKLKDGFIQKYGEQNDDGSYSLNTKSDSFKNFVDEISQYSGIEADINLLQVNPESVYDADLNAEEISNILFMIKDEEVNDDTQ